MKKFLFAFLFLSLTVWGQTLPGVRFGDGVPIWQGQSVLGVSPLLVAVSANATISFCSYPANAVPCTNKAQTYTDPTLGTACALNQQVVLATGNSCQATTDSLGNWGVWANAGQYAYTVTVGGQSFGPYPATLGGSSGGGGGSNPTPGVSNDLLFSNGTGGFQVDSGNIYYTPATHFLNAYGLNILGNAPFLINGLPNTSPCTPGPAGKIQLAFCPGPLATLSYNQDGPFPIARLGIVGQTATNLPTSTYMPLDANNTLPLGSLGDVGLMRVNSGVAGIVNPASLTSATRFNVYGGTNGFGSNSQMVALNYSASAGAFQVLTDKTGSASSLGLQFCTGGVSCNGWQLSGGTTPGVLFPVSGNTNPDIGAAGVSQVRNLFLQGALVNSGQYTQGCVNDATGTQIGLLAKRSSVLNGTTGQLECTLATTSDTTGLLGVVVGESSGGTCGVGSPCTTGVAYVAFKGQTTAVFDGTTTAKHWAIASTSTAGDLSDSGTACAANAPANVDVLGCIQSANSGPGTYAVDLSLKSSGSGSGGLTGTLTQNFIPKASTTGANPAVQNTTIKESGSPAIVSIPRFENTRYTDQFIWTAQTPAGSLTGGTTNTVTLSPCPVGVDASGDYRLGVGSATYGALSGYQVLVTGGGNSETPFVTGGTCTSGAASGTIIIAPVNSYINGYTVQSASSGIQEAINDGCGATPTPYYLNSSCRIVIPASATPYPVPGRIFFHTNFSELDGRGATLACTSRGPCLQIGRQNDTSYHDNIIRGISFQAPTDFSANAAYAGCLISSTQRTSGTVTITTSSSCGFQTTDPVTILWTDNSAYWGDVPYITVTSGTTFTYQRPGAADLGLQTTPGVVALSYEPILDNGQRTRFVDISGHALNAPGLFNNFFDFWDDQAATVDGFDSGRPMNHVQNWTGTFIFSGGASNLPDTSHQLAPVIGFKNANITGNNSSCATILNSNGFYFEDSVCQATGPWQWNIQSVTGNFQGANIQNAYAESSVGANPASPASSPWPGTGIAGLLARSSSGVISVKGSFPPQGAIQTAGAGGTLYYYFLVTHDSTAGTVSSPALVYEYNSTGSDAPVIPWPRQANGADTITYDLIRTTVATSLSSAYGVWPYNGNCTGGSPTACGSVVTGQAQCSGFVCTFTDSGAANTTSYAIANGNWAGQLTFLPGSYVTASNTAYMDTEPSAPSVGLGILARPLIVTDFCDKYGLAQAGGGYTSCLAGQLSNNNSNPAQAALILADGNLSGGSYSSVFKGRLNFSASKDFGTGGPHHIITLIDSNSAKTRATNSFRPPADANDTYIGIDTASGAVSTAGLSMGAPVSISQYIGNTGDNTSYLSRLTSSLQKFTIPVQATTYQTGTKCAATGSAASPSLVACSAAAAGQFSCATNASGATCVISTTAVTSTSTITITPSAAYGTQLSVTCNTTADAPTGPRLASISNGVSFTINLGTFTTNPECYGYTIIN